MSFVSTLFLPGFFSSLNVGFHVRMLSGNELFFPIFSLGGRFARSASNLWGQSYFCSFWAWVLQSLGKLLQSLGKFPAGDMNYTYRPVQNI